MTSPPWRRSENCLEPTIDRPHTAAPPSLPALLAALAAIAPFAIDTYLPAFTAIAAELQTSQLAVQQTLTAYLLPYAIMSLWHGALSDALGRRRVVLWTLAAFLAASLFCAGASRIEHLWLGRALQGVFAGAGMVVGRAVARDLLSGGAAQRLLAQVAMIFGLAPAIAPIVGGWLFAAAGWRSVFVFLALYAAVLWLATWRTLPETLPPAARRPLDLADLRRGYAEVFGCRDFWHLSGALACNFTGFFLYVLSAPVFLMQHLGVSAQGFAWLFGPTVAGMMLGSALSARLAGSTPPARTVGYGYALMLVAAGANLLVNTLLPPTLPWPVLPLSLYNVGMALAMPALTLQVLDLFGQRRGMVSSCQGFIQGCANALVAGVLAPLAWGSTLSLATAQASLLGLGLLLWTQRPRTAASAS